MTRYPSVMTPPINPSVPQGGVAPMAPSGGGGSAMLKELLPMLPALLSSAGGNKEALAGFMEGYQRTLAQLKNQGLQQDELAMRDRDRQQVLARQSEQDRMDAEDRARRHAIENTTIAPKLAEAGAMMDSPQGAESAIDALYQQLQGGGMFGDLSGSRDMAIRQATQTITAKQKRQMAEYVSAADKNGYVSENPEHGPAIFAPPHIVQMMPDKVFTGPDGKPYVKLSDAQEFAQLPVGRARQRPQAAVGSFEDYVQRTYGDNPTPDQVLEARKAYNQSDDRAPRVTVNTGDKIDRNAALKFQDDYARDSKPYLTLRDAYQRVKSAKPDAAGDLSLIFAYMKILDPNSVVREQEFANAQNAAGVPDQIRNLYNKTMQGVRLNPEQRRQFMDQAEALFENAKRNQRQVRQTYGNRAKQWGIPENMVLDDDPLMSGDASTSGTVKMRAPNGQVRDVPADQVEHFKGLGAVVVKG